MLNMTFLHPGQLLKEHLTHGMKYNQVTVRQMLEAGEANKVPLAQAPEFQILYLHV